MMDEIRKALGAHRFRPMFLDLLGWDRASSTDEWVWGERKFQFRAVAQKRGFLVLHCSTGRVELAGRGILRKAQQHLAKTYHEHIVIYSSEQPRKQVWQWAVCMPDGRRLRHREHPFFSASPPAPFVDRLHGLGFSLEEAENATLLDTLKRVRMPK